MATWSLYWSLTVAVLSSLLYLLSGSLNGGQAVASAILLWSLGTIVFLLTRALLRAVVPLVRGGLRRLIGAFRNVRAGDITSVVVGVLLTGLLTGLVALFLWAIENDRILPAYRWLQERQAWRMVKAATAPLNEWGWLLVFVWPTLILVGLLTKKGRDEFVADFQDKGPAFWLVVVWALFGIGFVVNQIGK